MSRLAIKRVRQSPFSISFFSAGLPIIGTSPAKAVSNSRASFLIPAIRASVIAEDDDAVEQEEEHDGVYIVSSSSSFVSITSFASDAESRSINNTVGESILTCFTRSNISDGLACRKTSKRRRESKDERFGRIADAEQRGIFYLSRKPIVTGNSTVAGHHRQTYPGDQ